MALAHSDDLASLLTPAPPPAVSAVQGFMTAWNGTTYANTVTVGDAVLTNLPVVSTATPASLGVDTLVLLLRVRNTYYILGAVTHP